ncbi:MAG: sigma-70 family RNA polymerase sigma factor [Planctomycetota bacterium]|nr:sigma-70 family RNA polymerase sigma factor [Planctomycetota bacterium]MDP7249175.1 sigma-70 family RNA polymerase sigma factor [Planctomycetota bacterium]
MPDPEADERKLVERVAEGDEEAFEALVDAHEGKLLGFLTKMSGSPDVAREVAQEALVKAFFKAHTFDFRCSFFTWLCEIAIRKFLDLQKKQKRWLRKHAISDLREQFDQPGKALGPVEEAQSREAGDVVRAAIAQLSPNHQTVLMLRELQGASYEEIAAAMNCSLGTVESRLFRARQKLKQVLEPLIARDEL